jgi:hypothetical protein
MPRTKPETAKPATRKPAVRKTKTDKLISTVEAHWAQAEDENWSAVKWIRLLGLPVVDATERLPIHLSVANVKTAVPNSHAQCSYANALRDVSGVIFSWVYKTGAIVVYGDKVVRYSLPTSVQKEVVVNDRNPDKVEPGEYYLSPIKPSDTMTARKVRNGKRPAGGLALKPGSKPQTARRYQHITKARVSGGGAK